MENCRFQPINMDFFPYTEEKTNWSLKITKKTTVAEQHWCRFQDSLCELYRNKWMILLRCILNVPGCAPNDVYSQVMGSDAHGIVRTLGKGASPSLVDGPVYKLSQAEKRDFDTRVAMEVQKATLAMKIEMTKKISEAKIEMEEMDKKFLEAKEEAKEDKEAMERKLSKAKRDMEEIIADKVKKGIQA